ncbi:DUF72 domain-containing protein [Tessaracoccus sp. ZS01]|nr:DUF72 domain-containing protein [Tessaracoccus sp. ZS01]
MPATWPTMRDATGDSGLDAHVYFDNDARGHAPTTRCDC